MKPVYLCFLAAAGLVAAFPVPSFAQSCTTSWTAAAGGVWNDAANWDNGIPDASDTVCITTSGTYTVAAGTTDRTVAGLVVGGASGTQTLTTANTFTVSGDAHVAPNGRWELLDRTPGGSDGLYATGTVLVEGVLEATGGTSLLPSGGTLDVAPGGTLRLVNGADAGGVSAQFRIRGLLEASCPPTSYGFCSASAPLDVEGGLIRIVTPAAEGRLDIRAGGMINDVTIETAAGTTLYLTDSAVSGGAPFVVEGTVSGEPEGNVYWYQVDVAAGPAGATLAMGGTGFQLVGSTGLPGATTYLTSAGGAFVNTGLLLRPATGSNFAGLRGVVVTNVGTVEIPNSLALLEGAVLRNEPEGLVAITAGGDLSGDGRLENAGLIVREGQRDGVGGTFHFGGLLYSEPGSEIRSNDDRLDLDAPGSRTVPGGVTLTGTGTFRLPLDLEPEGTVSPGTPGQPVAALRIITSYRPSETAGNPQLVIDVDAGGASDTLAVDPTSGPTPPTRLGGTLVVRVQPDYVPTVGDEFTILTNGTRAIVGAFSQVIAEGAPSDVTFVAELTDDETAVVLRAIAAVGVEDGGGLPAAFALGAPWPNPFSGSATVAVSVPERQHVEVAVFDLLGRRVAVLHDGPLAMGAHPLVLDVRRLPAGLYVVRAAAPAGAASQQLTVVR